MADNVPITPGVGLDVATDQVTGTGEHIQLFKLAYSADGVRTLVPVDADGVLVNLGANNEVTGPLTDAELRASPVDVEVTASALPTGAATEATLAAVAGAIDTEIQALVTAIQIIDNVIAGNEAQVDIVSGTLTTVETVTNLAQMGGVAIAMGTGVRTAGTQRVTIATDDVVPVTGPLTDAQLRATPVEVFGTVTSEGGLTDAELRASPVDVEVTASALPTGAATEATLAAVAGAIDTEIQALVTAIQIIDNVIAGNEAQVDIVAPIPAGDNNIGNVDIVSGTLTTVETVTNLAQMGGAAIAMGTGVRTAGTQRVTIATDDVVPVVLGSPTSGGPTTHHKVSAASTNATNVKASAGQLFGWYIYNSNAAARKVAFHNASGTPTAGASIYFTLVIPPTSGANVFCPQGIPFSTGIAYTMVTGLADNDATPVAANDLIMNIWYS